jgi:hypothetical protein
MVSRQPWLDDAPFPTQPISGSAPGTAAPVA